jgi:hypothetical protein
MAATANVNARPAVVKPVRHHLYCGGKIETTTWEGGSVADFLLEHDYASVAAWAAPTDDPAWNRNVDVGLWGNPSGHFAITVDWPARGVPETVVEACDSPSLAAAVEALTPLLTLLGVVR